MAHQTYEKGKTYWSGGSVNLGVFLLQVRENRTCLGEGSVAWPDSLESFDDEMGSLSRFLDFETIWDLLELVDGCSLFNHYPGYMPLDCLRDEFDGELRLDEPPTLADFADIVARVDCRLIPTKCQYGHLTGRRYLSRRTVERLHRDMPQGVACIAPLDELVATRSILDAVLQAGMARGESSVGDCLLASGWRLRDGYYERVGGSEGIVCSLLSMGDDREDSFDDSCDGIVPVLSREGYMSGIRANARHASPGFVARVFAETVDVALSRRRVDNAPWNAYFAFRGLDDGPIYTHRVGLWHDMIRALVERGGQAVFGGWAVHRCSCGRYFIRREGIGRPREKCGRCR